MISPYEALYDPLYLTEDSYEKLSVIESCHQAMLEDVNDTRVISTATAYTYSMVMEFLDSVKARLFKLCSFVLSLLNSYILNNARYLDKYREILKERIKKLPEPFSFSYYEYPFPKDYPVVIPGTNGIDQEIKQIQEKIQKESWVGEKVAISVDAMLKKFGRDTVGEDVDVYDLKASVTEIVTRKCRGELQVHILTESDIDAFIKDFQSYKPYADDIKRTKTNIEKDYILLKKTYERAIKMPEEIKDITRLEIARDPELASFKAQEQNRFAEINLQMTRLFTGFIKIYDTAFDTKLQLLQERIATNKAVINQLLVNAGIMSAVNTKTPDQRKKPYKYEPKKIKT